MIRGMRAHGTLGALVLALGLTSLAPIVVRSSDAAPLDDATLARIVKLAPLGEPPRDSTNAYADDPAAARFGQFLFFEKRLSADGQVSCSTCHDPARGFADGKTTSTHDRHVPSLWNVAWQRWLFWDGRADSLWSQALKPLEETSEMHSDRTACVRVLWSDGELRSAYEAVFGALPDMSDTSRFPLHARPVPSDPRHPEHVAWTKMSDADRQSIDRAFVNIGKAIAAYERRLVSRNSKFDRFADALKNGDASAQAEYGAAERRGLALFLGKGECRLCHAGPNFSDNEFHNIAVPPLDRQTPRDAGRHAGIESVRIDPFNAQSAFSDDPRGERALELDALTRTFEMWGQFKTPTLRNVARTAPYMHQGQMATLTDVLRYYSKLENAIPAGHHNELVLKPLELSDGEIADLVAFLESLTDESLPKELLSAPSSPRFTPADAEVAGRGN
jgi:cytochrome c peroxidase